MEKEFNQAEYINEWQKQNTTSIKIRLNKETDADIIVFMSNKKNKQGYIKELIRKVMRGNDL